ncbi:MAG: hypothetical protein HOB37_13125 [Rhodospirillaceae bacterium]|nr:hypothetical protein [Rhodospirillaceae bacterium]MBT5514537.1 hypothetical protein [Rhodospirillaceae bacterium]MBT6609385.1 hypothetical protein [Rhodospirillaceae bacterium]MBT7250214.1 hypothetical protein [Rhodospirillaceae bacterium]
MPSRRTILSMGVVVLVSALCAEIFARIWLWTPPANLDLGTPRRGLSVQAVGDWSPSQDAIWMNIEGHPFYVHINDQGFRNIENLRAGARRILALGDSFTFGLHVSSHDIWTNVTEQILNADGATDVQVLNNGLPGSTIVDHGGYLTEKGKRIKPQTVLFSVFTNDLSDLAKSRTSVGRAREVNMQFAKDASGAWHEIRWYLRHHSGLYVLARELKDWFLVHRGISELEQAGVPRMAPTKPTDPQPVSGTPKKAAPETAASGASKLDFGALKKSYAQHFHAAVDAARSLGSQVRVVMFPDYFEMVRPKGNRVFREFPNFVTELCRRAEIPMLDLTPVFAKHDPHLLYLMSPVHHPTNANVQDQHLSRAGNIVAGKEIAAFLKANK